jgi:hypothetical protein
LSCYIDIVKSAKKMKKTTILLVIVAVAGAGFGALLASII